jgi:hypothetical protein
MDSEWASSQLHTIRTLMERSAVYRRALAPVMIAAGVIGALAGFVPLWVNLRSNRAFALYWAGVSVVALAATYLLVRRQALRDQEPFWSPPTRRITQALVSPFIGGATVAILLIAFDHLLGLAAWHAAAAWLVLYGCALSAAGFFTPRGLGAFGRALLLVGCAALLISPVVPGDPAEAAHYLMATTFGVLHLAYGIYLYFTERRRDL